MSRAIFWGGALAGMALFAGTLFVHRAATEEGIFRRELAALASLEANAAREWRVRSGFARDLGRGASGADVSLLQKTLANQNFLSTKDISGVYGARTQAAVRLFQKEEALPETGVFDSLTRARVNRLYFDTVCPTPAAAYPDFLSYRVDKEHPLPYQYAPADLAPLRAEGVWTNGIVCMRKEAMENLERMAGAAAGAGVHLGVTSGFRSADVQKALFDYWLAVEGESARSVVAPPAASEHQLGVAADLTGASVGFEGTPLNFDKTPEGRWLQAHAWEFGFVPSYPKGREAITAYIYEPWHYRFVGMETAAAIRAGRVGTAEYLSVHGDDRYPRFKGSASGLELSARGVLALYIPREGAPKKLLEKEAVVSRPIASVTKLLTALVAEEFFPPGTLIPISPAAAREAVLPTQSRLAEGEAFSIEEILTLLLIESSNPAARALADAAGQEKFLALMREEATKLGLDSVAVRNATGLDPAKEDLPNQASPSDLAALFREVLDRHPALRTILGTPEARVRSTRGNIYRVRATNVLLSSASGVWPAGVFAGKTGETPRAKQALVFAAADPGGKGYVVGVLLESQDRFGEAKKVLDWLAHSYDWMAQN